jgi:predicted site-specific integrase-resolvase
MENLPQYVRVSQLLGTGPYKGQRPIFAVTRQTIGNWYKTGILPPPIRAGRSIMWRAEDIRAALARLEHESR